jgi:acylphosphatase
MMVCKRVLYSGQVQGVGFRYTTQSLAQQFAVSGFVRNLPSGDVEMVAEGEADEVQGFLDALQQRMARYIRETRVLDAAPTGQTEFVIRA